MADSVVNFEGVCGSVILYSVPYRYRLYIPDDAKMGQNIKIKERRNFIIFWIQFDCLNLS